MLFGFDAFRNGDALQGTIDFTLSSGCFTAKLETVSRSLLAVTGLGLLDRNLRPSKAEQTLGLLRPHVSGSRAPLLPSIALS